MIELPSIELSTDPRLISTNLGTWTCCSCAPGSVTHPDQLDSLDTAWINAPVPGTVAAALNDADRWDPDHPPALNQFDWWYRTRFAANVDQAGTKSVWLNFAGLATLADVWLNGEQLLETDNMFRRHRVDVTKFLNPDNTLAIRFRSLADDLNKKRPRPRWKTRLVNQQQLRWRRTTLLGQIPGWSPPIPAIGPWREIRLEAAGQALHDLHVTTRVEGTTGVVSLTARLPDGAQVDRARLCVGDYACPLVCETQAEGITIRGELAIPEVSLWWPHTHGDQPRYDCRVTMEFNDEEQAFDCEPIGFRQLSVDRADGFSLSINGQPIYCRGACWTISDAFRLDGSEASLRRDLTLARDAGVNMLRVIGSMIYESDRFYRLCDELGILVWQDFMFANMDYPVSDPEFAENIHAEAIDQLTRLSSHPSLVVYCGNSEVEQQAAMLGIDRDQWSNSWFTDRLPGLIDEFHPGVAYVPSTPTGGVLPFHPNAGICHYYGVGAYLRSPAELRQTNVKFTSECLGFSNVPEPDMVNSIMEGLLPATHHPRWKQRIPRDSGAGWDFEDVRDHYLKQLASVDPLQLRSTDMNRYLDLSRVVPGEMMAQTFSEWRSSSSQNRGGLIWFYKDLWPAAGWGILDSSGLPKAAYYFLKRVWSDRQITLTDEGLNGIDVHLINERSEPLQGFVEIVLLKEPNIVIARHETPVEISQHGRHKMSVDAMLGHFHDVSYAYRFGPPQHDLVAATLYSADRQLISEAYHFVRRRESQVAPAKIDATSQAVSSDEFTVTLTSDRFLYSARLSANRFLPDDNYFHLMPNKTKTVRFRRRQQLAGSFQAELEALNLESPIMITAAHDQTQGTPCQRP